MIFYANIIDTYRYKIYDIPFSKKKKKNKKANNLK